MIQSALLQSHRNFSLILICAMLGACASTQRSSTGSGEQAAAPISEGPGSQVPVTTGDAPKASANGAAGVPPKADAVTSAGQPNASSGANRGSAESSGKPDNEEAALLKRQLADQDAQINRLRTEQQVEAEREEMEAAKMREQEAAAAGVKDQQGAAGAATAATAASSGKAAEDEAAVFPANASASQPAGSESSEAAVQRTVERSVYFGYDQTAVADEYDDMLVANATYLKAHPALTAEVQGNCDERGSREYNLALGARRAMAVKRALELAGADGSRIAAISYGAEKPVATGKDEASYSQNRRADIVY